MLPQQIEAADWLRARARKTCTKCKKRRSLSRFFRNRTCKDGLSVYCKECQKAATDDWRIRNKQRISTVNRIWYRNNIKHHAAQTKQWKQNNRDRVCEGAARQRVRWPEKVAARQAVSDALRAGRMVRQPCAQCGKPNAHAHHPDYSEHLYVVWLCRKHHAEAHSATTVGRSVANRKNRSSGRATDRPR